jgi:hypothetical protein
MSSRVSPKRLRTQLVKAALAEFDFRCAAALAEDLERSHADDIGPRAWGMLTGLAVSYARPFMSSNGFGVLGSAFRGFGDRTDLKEQHKSLIEYRKRLFAHNEPSRHRQIEVYGSGSFFPDRPSVLEGRAPINAAGASIAHELCRFQEARAKAEAQRLAVELEKVEGWAGQRIVIDIDSFRQQVDTDAT